MNIVAGKMTRQMLIVATHIEGKNLWALITEAYHREWPCLCIFWCASITIIVSSTTIPNATVSEASVSVLSGMPQMFSTPMLIATVTGMDMPATRADLMGNSSIITMSTMTMASMKSPKNPPMASFTTFGWLAMCVTFIPGGSVFLNSSTLSSTSLPKDMMSPPLFISMHTSTARLPLLVM